MSSPFGDGAYDHSPAGDSSYDRVEPLIEAERALANHRVHRAHEIYSQTLMEYPNFGQAAAGKAITSVLLLPGMDAFTAILVESLGARRALNANNLLYAQNGYLYWLSRGTRWDDDGQYQGIRSLLAEQLPWPKEKLESLEKFAQGLNLPIQLMMDLAVTLADDLETIHSDIQIALDDESFARFYIPGDTFYDEKLNVVLGRSELALLQAFIGLARTAIYFIAAYEHTWTLDEAWSSTRYDILENRDHPLHIPSWKPTDYTVNYLDRNALRNVLDESLLTRAQESAIQALADLQRSMQYGLESEHDYLMQWTTIDRDYAHRVMAFVIALQESLSGPTPLPFSSPETTIDLSLFFTSVSDEDNPEHIQTGRTLKKDTSWMVRVELVQEAARRVINDEEVKDSAPEMHWKLSERALQQFFVNDGVFLPAFEVGEKDSLTIEFGEQSILDFVHHLIGAFQENVQDVYFTTR